MSTEHEADNGEYPSRSRDDRQHYDDSGRYGYPNQSGSSNHHQYDERNRQRNQYRQDERWRRDSQSASNDHGAAGFFAWIRESRLVRSQDRWIAGVCSGIAERIGWSPTLVRAILVASTPVFGFGVMFYAFAWFFLPDAETGCIMAEDLVNGQWDWKYLGPVAMVVVVLAIALSLVVLSPSVVAGALGLLTLYVTINNLTHRERMAAARAHPAYATPDTEADANPANPTSHNGYSQYSAEADTGSSMNAGNQGQNNPAATASVSASVSSYAHDLTADIIADASNPHLHENWYAKHQQSAQRTVKGPVHQTDGDVEGTERNVKSSATEHRQHAEHENFEHTMNSGFADGATNDFTRSNTSATTMTSPYQAPYKPLPPRYVRRKPAGFALVAAVLGAVLISAAAVVVTRLTGTPFLSDILQTATLWAASVSVCVGLIIGILGLMGRRSGGLMPLAWVSGFLTVCMLAVSLLYSFILGEMHQTNASYRQISVTRDMSYDSSDAQWKLLQDGIAFTGKNIDAGTVSIDLTKFKENHANHKLQLANGKTVDSDCPTGQINLTAYRTKVDIVLPQGCSYAFGGHYWQYYPLTDSVGGAYAAMRLPGQGSINSEMHTVDYENPQYWWINDPKQRPRNGQFELTINASHVIEANVSVSYQSDDATKATQGK